MEKQRDKFTHINDVELGGRRQFVDESKGRIERAKREMQSEEVKDKFLRGERALDVRRVRKGGTQNGTMVANGGAAQRRDSSGEDASFLDEGRSERLLMMRQQDDTLDSLNAAVSRVGYMAETIREEIYQHNKMLNDFEDDLADAEEQLGMVMGKLAKLLKTKNKFQLGMIIILSLVLLLFFLVLYT